MAKYARFMPLDPAERAQPAPKVIAPKRPTQLRQEIVLVRQRQSSIQMGVHVVAQMLQARCTGRGAREVSKKATLQRLVLL